MRSIKLCQYKYLSLLFVISKLLRNFNAGF